MALVSIDRIDVAFGGAKVLDSISCQIEPEQRICLLGRNGAGKSTLMKIIAGTLDPDNGTVSLSSGCRISYFAQDIPEIPDKTIFEIVAKGLGKKGELMARYHSEEKAVSADPTISHDHLHELSEELNRLDAWSVSDSVAKITSLMSLDPELNYADLSGGQKRRVLLAQALVSEPDVLLLDEPTNHLDVESIEWLESFLLKLKCSILFVTHDRMLLKKVATRIIELDRGSIIDWSCDYVTFLERKQLVLDAEEKEWARFDKKLADEEVWIRKGIKARRTRNEGRVRALKKMREERGERREREGTVKITVDTAPKSGVVVVEAKNISYGYNDAPLFQNFSTLITRGDKIGIVGSNGCGKTTLVKVLLGEIEPHGGKVKHGTKLKIAYFDQLREQLNPELSARQNILPNGDHIEFDGKRKHIIGYLQDFLFTPERIKTPVKYFSGGERNRLLLARLFTQSVNFIVFDEPTNDLDAETLELLEDLLISYTGTVLLICHDRTFLNNVVTSTFVFEDGGVVTEFVGGYDELCSYRQAKELQQSTLNKTAVSNQPVAKAVKPKTKLSYHEVRELKKLPEKTEKLEQELELVNSSMLNPEVYMDKDAITAAKDRLVELEQAIETAYDRWAYLETFA